MQIPKLTLQKKLAIIIGLIILIGGAALAFAWMQMKDSVPSPAQEQAPTQTISSAPVREETFPVSPVNLLVIPANGEDAGRKTIENRVCGTLYKIPSNWLVNEYLGVTKLYSPEDIRENAAWNNTHPEIVEQSSGDAAPGPDQHRFAISCTEKAESYILKNFSGQGDENNKHLADVFVKNEFHTEDTDISLVRTLNIDGWTAYEIARTYKQLDGTDFTVYSIIIELNRPHAQIVTIDLGETEYLDLSEDVKQVVDYISFRL